MNIPVLRTNAIIPNTKRLDIDGNVLVKGNIRANNLIINDKSLEESIFDTTTEVVEANKLYTWIKWSHYENGYDSEGNPSLTDTPVSDSVYMGIAYNQSSATESEDPTKYDWSKIQGDSAIQYYTWIKFATGPNGEGMNDTPLDETFIYMGIAYNKTASDESSDPTQYTWSKFVGPQGVTGPQGWTWIKYATGPNGEGITESPVGVDYIGIAYNKSTEAESNNPADYAWSLFKGPQGITGPKGATGITGAAGLGGISIITSNSNFSFTSDFDGQITESSYSNATTTIIVLDGINTSLYSNVLVGPTDYSYTSTDNITYFITDKNGNVQLSETDVYSLLTNSQWIIYSATCNDIQISELDKVIEPSVDRDYVVTIHPTQMNPVKDTASIVYSILGKNSNGDNFRLVASLFFSKTTTGPGVIYRGNFDSSVAYYDTNKRRDIVYSPGIESNYWMTSNPLKNGFSTWETPGNSTDWTPFGAEFNSIATGVIISEESYVKNTLNIGTNSNNQDANMTLWGGDDFPFLAIGQSGSSMKWGATGVWMGVYNKDTDGDGIGDTKGHAFSIGDQSASLRWDGEKLVLIGNMMQYETTADYGQSTPSGWVASTKYVDENVAYRVEIVSSNGIVFKNDIINTTLTAIVKKGNTDVTNTIPDGAFIWTRKSDNQQSDVEWNTYYSTRPGKVLILNSEDVDNKAVFECTVQINEN